MARPIYLAALILAGLSAPSAARAQATDAGAEEISAAVTAGIRSLLEIAPGFFAPPGPVAVEVVGDHYRLTVPGLTVVKTGAALAGIEATVVPTPEGWLRATPTFDDPLVTAQLPGDGFPRTLTVAAQSGSVTWAPAYRAVMDADLALAGLALKAPDVTRFDVARIGFDAASTPRGGDRYDQALHWGLEDLDLVRHDGHVRIGGIGAGLDLDAFDLVAFADLRAGAAADTLPALWSRALTLPAPFDAAVVRLDVDGHDQFVNGGVLSVDRFAAALSIEGFRADGLTLDLRASWSNLVTPPVRPDAAPILPHDLTLDVSLRGLPSKGIGSMLRRWQTEYADLDLPEIASVGSGELVLAMLLRENVVLDLAMTWEAPAATVEVTGSFHPAPGTRSLVVGTAHVTIGRIDDAIAMFGAYPSGAHAVQVLTMLKLLGVDATAADGTPLRAFDIEVTPAGAVMVNGADLGPMLGVR